VKANPGSRGEQIAAALGTSDVWHDALADCAKPERREEGEDTRGQRRGMTYFAAGAAPGWLVGGRR
jgi:hypothetical protein